MRLKSFAPSAPLSSSVKNLMISDVRVEHGRRNRGGFGVRALYAAGIALVLAAVSVPAQGQGVTANPKILSFTSTNVGATSASQNIVLTTTGAGNTIINSISVTPDPAGNPEFTIGTVTGCVIGGAGNATGSTCTIPVTFSPAYPGTRWAPLVVVTSTKTYQFGLSGTGLSPQAVLFPGTLSTSAGTGTAGATGDGGQATAATLNTPRSITWDASGNYYIADLLNNRIRKVTPAGVITTVAGGGATNYVTNPGGPATSAALSQPASVAFDPAGNMYIADFANHVVARVDAVSQAITVYAGTGNAGYSGDGGPATAAKISGPGVVLVDPATGNLYIADPGLGANNGGQTIRLVNAATGNISTYAGNGTQCAAPANACGDGGLATAAQLNQPNGLALDTAGNLYISDIADFRIRVVSKSTGNISTVVGTGTAGYGGDGGPATSATIKNVFQIQVDPAGDLYLGDGGNNAIRFVSAATKIISTIVGNGTACTTTPSPACGDGGPANVSALSTPNGVALDVYGNIYVGEAGTSRVRKVTSNPTAYAYATTAVGSTSTDSPKTAYLQNIGNSPLTLTVPAAGTNASISPGFTQGNSETCPQLTSGSTTGTLAVGAQCSYVISFTPDVSGTNSGSLVETDNSLNAAGSTQTIGLSGTGTPISGAGDSVGVGSSAITSGTADQVTFGIPVVSGAAAPAGTVTFTANNGTTTVTLGTATWPTSPTTGTCPSGTGTCYLLSPATAPTSYPLGTDTVTATFAATSASPYASAAPTTTVTVTSATLTSNAPSPDTYGTPVTLTDTLTPINGVCPTASATFANGGTNLGTGTFTLTGGNCVATYGPTANLPVGPDNLTATTPASGNFAATSAPLTVTVNKAPVTNPTTPALSDTIAATPNPTTFGATDTLSFSVLVAAGDAAPTGSVTFTTPINGTTSTLGTAAVPFAPTATTTVINGITYTVYTASTTTTVLPQGTDTVTGTYTGDNNYAGGPLTTNVVVNAAAATATLTASPSPSTYGTPVTITETINPINGVCPAGPATFLDNGTSIGTGAISLTGGKCVATLVTSNLPVGTDSLTATVPASNGFATTTTGPVSEIINKAPVTNPTTPALSDTISASPNPQTLGQPVALSFTVLAAAGNAAPTGTVTFTAPINGTTTTLNATPASFTAGGTTVINGVTYTVYTATASTTVLPQGSNTVTGTYTGDGNYAGGPLTTTEVVNATSTTSSLAVGPNPSTFGTPVTITETITPVNGVCPVGPATFNNNGTSIGTGAITLTNGQCIATLTTSKLPVGSDSITATVPADPNFNAITSGPAALVVNKANGADALTSSPNPSTFGQSVTITDTIPTVGGVAPTGTVNFYSYNTLIGTGTVNAQGVATLTTGTLPVGTDSLTGVYQGDANYAQVTSNAVNQVVNPVATTPTLSAGPNPTTFGTLVTITETIPTVNGVAPTGTVTFYQNGTQIGTGTINAQGVATITSTTLPVGTDPITATYPGDTNYAAVNSGPVNVTINKANGADTLTSSLNPAPFGTSVTFTDTIPTVGGVAPTGTVTFYNNGTSIGTGTVTNGVATLTTTTLPVGSNPITAVFGGDTNYAQVTSNQVNEVVTTNGTTPVLGATPNPTTYGTTVTLTESIPGVNGVTPTGTVSFYNGTTLLGTAPVTNGVATLPTSTLPIGTDPIKATYSGDTNYSTANTGPVNVVINKAAPTDTVTSNPNPSIFGGSVTLTFTVPLVNGVAPTGTVSFYNGTTLLGTGTVNAQGIATVTTSTLPVGSDTITAQYPGDNTYAAANPTTTQVVNQNNGTANLAVGPNPSTFGTPVTITETITPVNGVCPVGPATFNNNGTSIGTGAITLTNGQCIATLTTSKLPVGSDSITATVPADPNFNAITSGPAALVVNKANGADALTSSPNPSTFGQSVTITDTIPTVGGVAPTGTVNFYSYNTLIGTGTVNAQGVATLTTGTLPVGTDSLTGVYQGDANYAQVTSNAVNQVVNPVATTPTLSAGPNPTTFGTLVTITETIPTVNGVAPTGTVTFYQNGTQIGTGTINAQGVASITSTTLPVGTDPITATYPGDTNYAAVNSGPVSVTINKANGADTLTSSLNPAPFGTSVTFTDTIPTVGGVAPTGTVTFYNNGTSIGTGTVTNGVATLTTTTLPVGSNPITAVFGGDTNYAQVTSNQVNEVVTTNGTTPVLGATPNPTTYGTTVTLTESIPGVNGVTPTGTVNFYNGTTLLGTATVTNGVATLTTSTLPIGTDPIKATYSGDTNYSTANTGPVNVVINKAAPTDTVTANPSPSTYGTQVTLTFTVPLVNGVAPTGTVSFYNGTTLLGTGTVSAQGIATTTTSTLPVGSDTITAQYPGDNTYAASNPTTTEVVNAAAGNATLTVGPNPATFGTPVTITETIAPVNGKCPTGPATFLNNGTSVGTGAITLTNGQCVATLVTSTLPAGTDNITATVPPDANFAATNSGPVTVTIAPANPTSVISYGPQTPVCSVTLVTFTDTITPINGVVPTGTVQFYTNLGPLGTPQTLVNGVATLTIAVPCGTVSVYGIYTGNLPYGTSRTPTAGVTLADFTIAATPPTQTINPGDTVVYTVSLAGANGSAFNAPVTLTATGLPADATVTFGTKTYVPGVGPTPTSMTIVTSPLHAKVEPSGFGPKVFYGLLLLPLLGVRRIRRKIRSLPKGIVYGLAALMMLGGLGAITGCAGGYFGPAGAQYTITVTGTSGTLVHSTTVALTVR